MKNKWVFWIITLSTRSFGFASTQTFSLIESMEVLAEEYVGRKTKSESSLKLWWTFFKFMS